MLFIVIIATCGIQTQFFLYKFYIACFPLSCNCYFLLGIFLAFKGELRGKNEKFSKERPNIIATNFPILVALSYKVASNSPTEVDLKCD